MNEDEKAVQEVKNLIRSTLMAKFGYCGILDSKKLVVLNSGRGNIVINIKWE